MLITDMNFVQMNAMLDVIRAMLNNAGYDHTNVELNMYGSANLSGVWMRAVDGFNGKHIWQADLEDLRLCEFVTLHDDMTDHELLEEVQQGIKAIGSRQTRELAHLAWRLKDVPEGASHYSEAVRSVFTVAWNEAMERAGVKALTDQRAA